MIVTWKHSRVAALAFQGMIREALYAKCIFRSSRYSDVDLPGLCDRLVDLFLKSVGYGGNGSGLG